MSVAERIRTILKAEAITATQLGLELGINPASMGPLLAGKTLPSSKILVPLAKRGININWLLNDNYQGPMYAIDLIVAKQTNTSEIKLLKQLNKSHEETIKSKEQAIQSLLQQIDLLQQNTPE